MDSNQNSSSDPSSLKLALAIALLRFKNLHRQSSSSPSQSDALRWKRKAKERKRELQRLREELKQLEDGMQCEVPLQIASCKCHFFDGCGKLSPTLVRGGAGGREHWIDEVLRRRFLRLVRLKGRRKRPNGSVRPRNFIELNHEDEIEQLSTSIDFLVELSNIIFVKGENDSSFATLSHQAIDFIIASLKNLLSSQKDSDLLEVIANGMIMRLIKRMCSVSESDGSLDCGSDAQFHVQHIIRKLGNEPYIGQRTMLSISQRITILAESLLFMDPFDDAFPGMNGSMFMMIQLIEFLISDHMPTWTSNEDFDWRLFEEWVRSVLQARKALELLESRNGLYMLYMERVIGELAKQVGSLAHHGKLDLDIISNLFC